MNPGVEGQGNVIGDKPDVTDKFRHPRYDAVVY